METIFIFALFILAVFGRVVHRKMDSRKRQQKYAEYCDNRVEFFRQERLKVISSFWRKYRSGTYPVDVLLHQLKEGLCFNSGGSTEWQEEFALVIDLLNWENADEQHSFYQESQTVSSYTDGINLDAYYRIFGLTPETLTAESLKRRIAPCVCNIIPTATNSLMPPSNLTRCSAFMKPCNGSWRIKTHNVNPGQSVCYVPSTLPDKCSHSPKHSHQSKRPR